MVYQLGWTLMHSLWEGVAAAAMLAAVLACVPRRAAQARYLCNMVAMLAIVTAFAVTLAVSPRPSHLLPEAIPSASVLPSAPASVPALASQTAGNVVQMPLDVAGPLPAPQPASLAVKINHWINAVSPVVVRVWIAGVMLLGIWRVAAWISVQRLRVVKTEPADSAVLQTARRLADRLNLRRPFEILISHFTETPMVIGWLRPVILIPASALTGLSPLQLEGILAHELAHIRRHDYLVNLLQILAETLLFYHPAVWWISRQIRLEREQACDDVALSVCNDRCEYARSLAALEELRVVGLPALAAGGSGGRQMVTRIRRILRPLDDAPRWGWPAPVSLLVIALVAGLLYSQAKIASAGKASPATQPFSLQNDAPRLSPFTAVRWRGNVSEAQFKGTWYEVISINNVPTAKIMDYLTTSNDFAPQKHFAEDLVEVMRDMGSEPGKTVRLELKTLDTGKAVTIPDAPMTEENRRSVLRTPSSGPSAMNASEVAPIEDQLLSPRYKIRKGDLLAISVYDLVGPGVETVKQTRVSENGNISMPEVGQIHAAGLTEGELQRAVAGAYKNSQLIPDARVLVTIANSSSEKSDVGSPVSPNVSVAAPSPQLPQLEAERKRIVGLKGRYEMMRIQAEDDVKRLEKTLAEMGGSESGSGTVSPKAMELNTGVAQQIELESQKLKIESAWAEFRSKKDHGETPAKVIQLVDQDPEIIRTKATVDAIQEEMNRILSDSGSKNPKWADLEKSLEQIQKRLDDLRAKKAAQALSGYEAELTASQDETTKLLVDTNKQVAQLKADIAQINTLSDSLARRKEDVAAYRKYLQAYDHSLMELDSTIRTEPVKQTIPIETPSLPTEGAFKFDVPFQLGATQFLDGDQITVTSVKGTAADMQSGICCISGTYKLASHDHATLAASVTAADSKDGVGAWNDAQTMTVQKGTGTFKLLLPVSIKGWPHVSFYNGSDFGGSYIGTGDWVLRKWWGSKITDTTQPAAAK